jgi:hypothetical protein
LGYSLRRLKIARDEAEAIAAADTCTGAYDAEKRVFRYCLDRDPTDNRINAIDTAKGIELVTFADDPHLRPGYDYPKSRGICGLVPVVDECPGVVDDSEVLAER